MTGTDANHVRRQVERQNVLKQVNRFEDAHLFLTHVQDFLMQREAEHNLILGLLSRVVDQPDYYEDYYFGCVEDDDKVIAVAMRTAPHQLHLSYSNHPEGLKLIAQDVKDVFPVLPGVQGSKPLSAQFAEIWQQQTGQTYHLKTAMRIYKIESVIPVSGVPGHMRPATRDDVDLMRHWMRGFQMDTFPDEEPPSEEAINVWAERIFDPTERVLYLWEIDDKPVSMAMYTGRTPNGMRINAVYTPPEQRGKGYASACVAALCQRLFDQGLKFCFLYTDLGNPIPNHVYPKIGFEPVCDAEDWVFELSDKPFVS
jgi:predicted GNAT family acetyltransferase